MVGIAARMGRLKEGGKREGGGRIAQCGEMRRDALSALSCKQRKTCICKEMAGHFRSSETSKSLDTVSVFPSLRSTRVLSLPVDTLSTSPARSIPARVLRTYA